MLGPSTTSDPIAEPDRGQARWRMLALVSAAELLGMSVWFAAAAVAPQLRAQWGLDAARIGWLTAAVQLGFVAGTACAAALNLADVIPSRGYFAGSALLAALANAAIAGATGWRWAFPILALGPALGIAAIATLRRPRTG